MRKFIGGQQDEYTRYKKLLSSKRPPDDKTALNDVHRIELVAYLKDSEQCPDEHFIRACHYSELTESIRENKALLSRAASITSEVLSDYFKSVFYTSQWFFNSPAVDFFSEEVVNPAVANSVPTMGLPLLGFVALLYCGCYILET